MKKSSIITIVVIALLIVAGFWFYTATQKTPAYHVDQGVGAQSASSTNNTLGMIVEKNAIVVSDQKPGNQVTVSKVLMKAAGFVVIRAAVNGVPRIEVGSSGLLPAGEHDNVVVQTTRSTVDGETFYALMYIKTSSGTGLNSLVDQPAQSDLGGNIMANFKIDSKATIPAAVNI